MSTNNPATFTLSSPKAYDCAAKVSMLKKKFGVRYVKVQCKPEVSECKEKT